MSISCLEWWIYQRSKKIITMESVDIYIYIYLFIYTSKTKSFCINLWEYIFMIFIWKRPYFHPNDASDIWVIYSWHVVIYMYDLLLHNIVIVLMYLHYISDMYIIYVTITVIYQNTVHICVCYSYIRTAVASPPSSSSRSRLRILLHRVARGKNIRRWGRLASGAFTKQFLWWYHGNYMVN
jgi:hypothetical protein